VESSAGLREFSILQPSPAELERLARQIEAAGVEVERGEGFACFRDPFQNQVKLAVV
jgi:hypothetical protein